MNSRPLSELNGAMLRYNDRADEMLLFTCPACASGHSILVCFQPPSIYDSGAVWKLSGMMPNITVTPSIDCSVPWTDEKGITHPPSCKFHGWVRNGVVEW